MTEIAIVAALPQHAEAFLDVLVASFEAYRETLVPQSGVFRESVATIHDKLVAGGGFFAMDGDIIAGVVLYQFKDDSLYLGRLGVLPDYRKQGIAKMLISAVEQVAIKRQLPQIELGVRLVLESNQKLFKSLGYVITEEHCHEGYSETTWYTMVKRL
ncbi:MAG: GNAT family N-acetyltransferase [Anaerolineaceae bacterium]|nr:GNAT family N-acetyltransferase [Anaerolineaceae bacterium]